MGQVRGTETAFSIAADDLKSRIESLRSGDRVAILLTSRPEWKDAFFPLGEITDPQSLLARVEVDS